MGTQRFGYKSLIGGLILGIGIGAALFHASQPRSFLEVMNCQHRCYRSNELAGLLASAAIQQTPGLIPEIVAQNDECIAIRHPVDRSSKHFVLFPKKDIRNIAELGSEDSGYVMGCLAIVRSLVQGQHMYAYRVWTNGPGNQDVTYLHFHLAELSDP
jgi:hypothetical protein